jgi:hypothetical protein
MSPLPATTPETAAPEPVTVPVVTPGRSQESRASGESRAIEVNGPAGPEPTRFGDWERGGRCIDF